ncbi:ATP-dependent RNA helicase HrpA [Svornostia abyssi]|uniref:ATP-dependent RNA helicase HrpA n=1 Tax=Svornostia abyssi TaxID=2898438 RepID=A0ABY5PDF1_9ACTN|nr:ATP-dependent RNA helicase HrpA [Parviterribacteraceae bacterium J379]
MLSGDTDLRARLAELTLRDEHRLKRRMDRVRRGGDDQAVQQLIDEIAAAERKVEQRRASVPAITYPEQLPVSARRDELLETIAANQVTIVAGETGSGKTTQLPKMCLELGRGVRGLIGHTQPRRLAARTVADRIADELGVPLGAGVGYAIRFQDRTREDTLIQLMTDGLLLAQIDRDPLLRRYDTIIVDEAHERSLNIDFLLGYLKRTLPKRPDLKVIVTSATIDPEQFSRHFDDAPIVEVSGRTFPVEIRYRPVELDPADGEETVERDQVTAIGDAVQELVRESRDGDILVFLSGEREIRDTADALRGRFAEKLEILPLFARLSSPEQQKVFQAHTQRRVVLATNVAETSLTVPGIKYVVDPGTARISRYSARLKVQRLPIEAISQASANQRSGRCGRTSDGIAIRLYSEEDFAERPAFTDPEILRTSLAAVILQTAAAGLGRVEDFPFMEPPDARQVRDGVLLLTELGALDAAGELTGLGRKLARLPVDPRMGRMVLEAGKRGCAEEVIVIAAGLSIQDPRERPSEHRQAADEQHARFADERSDFLAYLNLWAYIREQQRALSGSAFRRRCRKEYLHYLRIREWQDLVAQLRQAAKQVGVKRNQTPAEPDDVHQALLAGLLSHIGLLDVRKREYQGARNARFSIFPGSVLSRKQPTWVMAAELVETSRLFARTAAKIEPRWIEPLADHLVARTYEEPRWDARRAQVVATERVSLYGLPIVTGRSVAHAKIDPGAARAIFLRKALVEREWDTRHAFVEENDRILREIEALEDRLRRRDLLVDDDTLLAFFDARVPPEIASGRDFDRWWKTARTETPDLLTFDGPTLIRPEAAASLEAGGRPSRWRQGDLELQLSYRFAPGEADDGITAHVPLDDLARLRSGGFEWLVPAMRLELVTALLRALPKEQRRALAPVPDAAADVLARLPARGEPLRDALSRELAAVRAVRVAPAAWDFAALPPHLRVTFRVEDRDGKVLDQDKDLRALRDRLTPKLRQELAAVTVDVERTALTAWPDEDPAQTVELPGTGGAVQGYPALVDEGATIGVRVFETKPAQQAAHARGTRRLLTLELPSPAKHVRSNLKGPAQLALAAAPHGSLDAVLEDATACAIDALIDHGGGPAWNRAAYEALRTHVGARLNAATAQVVTWLVAILDADREVQRMLDDRAAPGLADIRQDVHRQLGGLVFPGFLTVTGANRLPDVVRYLQGATKRLERLPDTAASDRDRMQAIAELEALYRDRIALIPKGQPRPAELREARWAIEELRVAQFAPGVKTNGVASAKRVRKLLSASR